LHGAQLLLCLLLVLRVAVELLCQLPNAGANS
jgi:hypothetical protein